MTKFFKTLILSVVTILSFSACSEDPEDSTGNIYGLVIDIFSDTMGLYALGSTVMSALRHPVVRLFFPREDELTDPRPSVDSLGLAVFLRYSVTLTLIFSIVVVLADSFVFFNPLRILLLIAGSTLITTALIVALDFITVNRREKRL